MMLFLKLIGEKIAELIVKFWREVLIAVLLLALIVGWNVFMSYHEATELEIQEAKLETIAAEAKVLSTKKKYDLLYKKLQLLKEDHEFLKQTVRDSQNNVSKIEAIRVDLARRISSIDLSQASCEEKFQWMRNEATRIQNEE